MMNSIMLFSDPISRLLGSWAGELGAPAILLRICTSFIFAAIIGYERANKRHSAGLRTFIIVSLASTTAMLLDLCLGHSFALISAVTVLATAIISTYSIFYSSKNQIKGLTTSVGLWACSIIGLSIGAGLYTIALVGFVATACCLSLLPPLEIYLKDRSNHFEIHLELTDKRLLYDFITATRKLGLKIDDIESNPAYLNSGLGVFSISLTIVNDELKKYKTHTEIIEALSTLKCVSYIEEMK